MKPLLFLLKPDFFDQKINDSDVFFCPHSALIEGILLYYPDLREYLDIRYVDFTRPRNEIIEFLGSENQLCPALIISLNNPNTSAFERYNSFYFTNEVKVIADFFVKEFFIGQWHP